MPGLTELSTQFQAPSAVWSAHSDLMVRYLSCTLAFRETSSGLLKVLSVFADLCGHLKSEGLSLHEAEAGCIVPQLIEKSGKF